MNIEYSRHDCNNASSSTSSSTTSSSTRLRDSNHTDATNTYNTGSADSTATTGIIIIDSSSSPSSTSPSATSSSTSSTVAASQTLTQQQQQTDVLANKTATASSDHHDAPHPIQIPSLSAIAANNNNNNNDKLIEQLVKQQFQMATLSRHHQQHQLQLQQQHHHQQNQPNSPCIAYKNLGQYVDLSASGGAGPHSTQTTTAYLVQTPNGNALLIPPPQLNGQQQQQSAAFSLSRHAAPIGGGGGGGVSSVAYGITASGTTIPLNHTQSSQLMASSSSATSNMCFQIPESNASSTNVYQTIEPADKNNAYHYSVESFYGNGTSANSNHHLHHHHQLCSTRRKSSSQKKCINTLQQQQQQQQQHFQLQQQHYNNMSQHQMMMMTTHHHEPSPFDKLIENSSSSSSHHHMNGNTATATTSDAIAMSPSSLNNHNRNHVNRRRHVADSSSSLSFVQRIKARWLTADRNAETSTLDCCSWKRLSILCLLLVIALCMCVAYLLVMRTFNLNWDLRQPLLFNNRKQLIANASSHNAMWRFFDHGSSVTTTTAAKNDIAPLFAKIGDTIEEEMAPYAFAHVHIFVDHAMHAKFSVNFSRHANIALYANRNSLASFTQHEFAEVLSGKRLLLLLATPAHPSSSHDMVGSAFIRFMNDGLWYISLFNDNKTPVKFRMRVDYHDHIASSKCPSDCNGRGECGADARCKCFAGYAGVDCSLNTCPVVCSGHGQYEAGKCVCEPRWHGDECSVPIEQCLVADCNGAGICYNGKCECNEGFEGASCERQRCSPEPTCSDRGVCRRGQCVCFGGFTGPACNESAAATVDSLCSAHGRFDALTRTCVCSDERWSDRDCSVQAPPRASAAATVLQCNSRCDGLRGMCMNGTCVCAPGYHGRHCDMNACPNSCSGNGECEQVGGRYKCLCRAGWTGVSCSSPVEMICNDGVDNDNDGLIDCMDSECCVFESCKQSLACTGSPEPKDRLLRKQPPSLSASFFDKIRFLIEEASVQSFAQPAAFEDAQASVLRGQVLFVGNAGGQDALPLIGVKVHVPAVPAFGYTITRHNGIFDLMVNGGGTIQLEFSREGLKTRRLAVNVAWNQFHYVVEPIVMQLASDTTADTDKQSSSCRLEFNNSYVVAPIVRTSWRRETERSRTLVDEEDAAIVAEYGVVRQELSIDGDGDDTMPKLVYSSNLAAGYASSVYVLLTRAHIPDELRRVHVRIVVEGVLTSATLDADANMSYEYAWDRRNAYEQRVYGLTTGKVMIGYEYEQCSQVHWHTQVVKLAGYELATSELGNWNLDVHHRLNVQHGILHKGDGSAVYLKEAQKVVEVAAGRRLRRHRHSSSSSSSSSSSPLAAQRRELNCRRGCPDANTNDNSNSNNELSFYAPYALSIGSDGAIFVADYNYVWMLNASEAARSAARRVLEFANVQQFAHKYYVASDPTASGHVYVSDASRRAILSVKTQQQLREQQLRANFRLVTRWQDIDSDLDADEASKEELENDDDDGEIESSEDELLRYPRCMTFDNHGRMYFVDGNVVKALERDTGAIRRVIGGDDDDGDGDEALQLQRSCNVSVPLASVRFHWPTSLAVNPVDNSLHVLDEDVVYRVSWTRGTLDRVVGVPFACSSSGSQDNQRSLRGAVDMAFSVDGELYVLENERRHVKSKSSSRRVRVVKTTTSSSSDDEQDRPLEVFVGGDSASEVSFNDPIAIAVHPNRSVYILDRGDNVLYHVRHALLEFSSSSSSSSSAVFAAPATSTVTTSASPKYVVHSPATSEAYVFNRLGLHTHTVDLLTRTVRYNFTYSGNAFYGKLIGVSTGRSPLITIKRDFHGRVESLHTHTADIKCKLNGFDMLRSVTTSSNRSSSSSSSFNFAYLGNSGLLTAKSETHATAATNRVTQFVYEKNGKVKQMVKPNQAKINLSYSINASGVIVEVRRPDRRIDTWITNSTSTCIYKNGQLDGPIVASAGSLSTRALANEDSLVVQSTSSHVDKGRKKTHTSSSSSSKKSSRARATEAIATTRPRRKNNAAARKEKVESS